MADKKEKPRKGCLRSFFGFIFRTCVWIVIFSILAGVGFLGWERYRGEKALAYINAQLDERHIARVTHEMLPLNEDATPYWQMALDIAGTALRLDYETFDWPQVGERVDPRALATLTDCNTFMQPTMPLITKARDMQYCDFHFTLPKDTFAYSAFLSKTRYMARTLEAQTLLGMLKRDSQMSVDACVNSLALSKALKSIDYLGHSARLAVISTSISNIQFTLGSFEFSESQLNQLTVKFKADELFNFREMCKNELLELQDFANHPEWHLLIIRHVMAQNNMVFKLRRDYPFIEFYGDAWDAIHSKPEAQWWDRLGRSVYDALQDMRVAQHQIAAKESADFQLQFYDAMEKSELTWQTHQQIIKQDDSENNVGMKYYFKAMTSWKTCQVALAVERYRMQHGQWPTQLSDVFEAVPEDAYGQPMMLHRTHDGVWIYSLGPDGMDHQGAGLWQDSSQQDKDDITFQLFDPTHRNHEPAPKPMPEVQEDGPRNLFDSM